MLNNVIIKATFIAALTLLVREFFLYFIFKRLDEFYSLKGDLAEAIVYYSRIYSNPSSSDTNMLMESQSVLRRIAARFYAFGHKRTYYLGLWGVPRKESIKEAAKNIMGLSNAVREEMIPLVEKQEKKIIELLGLEIE